MNPILAVLLGLVPLPFPHQPGASPARLDDDVDALVQALKGQGANEAIQALAAIGPEETAVPLAELIAADPESGSWNGLRALRAVMAGAEGRVKSAKKAAKLLAEVLEDERAPESRRVLACLALGQLASEGKSTAPALIELLHGDRPWCSELAACIALSQLGEPAAKRLRKELDSEELMPATLARAVRRLLAACALTAAGYPGLALLTGDRLPPVVLLDHFRPFVLLGAGALAPLAIALRARWTAALLALAGLLGLLLHARELFAGALPPDPAASAGGPVLSVLTWNVGNGQAGWDEIEQLLCGRPAELVALQEVPAGQAALCRERLGPAYPHQAVRGASVPGLALLSTRPLGDVVLSRSAAGQPLAQRPDPPGGSVRPRRQRPHLGLDRPALALLLRGREPGRPPGRAAGGGGGGPPGRLQHEPLESSVAAHRGGRLRQRLREAGRGLRLHLPDLRSLADPGGALLRANRPLLGPRAPRPTGVHRRNGRGLRSPPAARGARARGRAVASMPFTWRMTAVALSLNDRHRA